MGQSQRMEAIHLCGIACLQRHHHPIAHRSRAAIERHRHANPRLAARLAPGDEMIKIHHPPHAQLASDGIVKWRGAKQIIGAQGDITDHCLFLHRDST
jgi:hypothetical protein